MSIPNLQQLRKESAREQSKWPWWLWTASILAGLFVLVVILGFFAAPPYVRGRLERELAAKLHRPVSVAKVRINPLALSVTIEGLTIKTKDNLEFVSWKRFYANAELLPLLSHEARLSEFSLEGLEFHSYLGTDGKINFDDLIQEYAGGEKPAPAAAPSTSKPWAVAVTRLHIDCQRIAFTDRSRGATFSTDVVPIGFDLRDFHTTDAGISQGEFSAATESGERFTWKGGFNVASLASDGVVEVQGLSLPKYAPYFAPLVRFDLLDGRVNAKVSYHAAIENGVPVLKASDGSVVLTNLRVAPRGSTVPVVVLDKLEVAGASASTADHTANVTSIALTGGSVTARRSVAGIDLLNLVPAAPAGGTAAPAGGTAAPAASGPSWNVTLGGLGVSGLGIEFFDTSGPREAHVSLSALALKLGAVSTAALDKDVPVEFSADVAGGGRLGVTGTFAAAPVKFDLKTKVTTFPLAVASPYIEASAPLKILGGNVSVDAQTTGTLSAGGAPAVSGRAEVEVADFAAVDAAKGEELGGLKHLSLHGIEFVTQPQTKLVVAEVILTEPSGRIAVAADKSLNVAPAAKTEVAPAKAETPAPVAKPLPLSIAVDKVTIQKGRFVFIDQSVQPNVRTGIQDFGGTISGLSSANIARADVDLAGKVDGTAPFTVTGQFNPLSEDAFSDVKVGFRGIDLLPTGPYVGKFAGRELAKGSASLDLKVKFSKRQLDSTTVLTLDQFTLGAPTNSPDATSLPVGLALALLRDTSGKIVIDLPVQGSIDDPNFRIGKVVGRVLLNILTKAATSPFALLGSMFGGGGDELGYQEFAPGSAGIDPVNTKKLDVVSKALKERPGLSVEVGGTYDVAADSAVLREKVLTTLIRQALWEEMRKTAPGVDVPAPELLTVTPEGEARLITRFYQELAASTPAGTTPAAVAPTPPPAPAKAAESPSLFRRIANFFSSKPSETKPAPAAVATPAPASAAQPGAPAVAALPTVAEMRSFLLSKTELDENALRQLGNARAEEIRKYLVETGGAAVERVFLVPTTGGDLKVKLVLK